MPHYNWTLYYNYLYEVYIMQNKTLNEVQEIMKGEYGFIPR